MKYELDGRHTDSLILTDGDNRLTVSEDDFKKFAAAEKITVIIGSHSDLRLIEALFNSNVDNQLKLEEAVPINPQREFEVLIKPFEGSEAALAFVEGWGFPASLMEPVQREFFQPEVYKPEEHELVASYKVTAPEASTEGEFVWFEPVDKEHRKHPNSVLVMPSRSTEGSAGYDFIANEPVVIQPGETVLIYTDVKCKLDEGLFLFLAPRSNVGIKRKLMLANTVGIIDQDYYNNRDTGGNIIFALYNYGTSPAFINEEEKFGQGIVMPFYSNPNEKVTTKRTGGIGSTGR